MSSTLSKEVLLKHKKNNVFVETGTLWGDGVAVALECGYNKVISIEIDPDRVAANSERFADEIADGRVELVEGDTFDVFEGIVEGLDEPATFWLDAHWDNDGAPIGEYKCPLPFELDTIAKSDIRTHTLMIDDRRLFGDKGSTWGNTIDESAIYEQVTAINKSYFISYEDGHVEKDVIVASC